MLSTSDLMTIALERLTDAETLLNANRYNGAVYLYGYSIEIALKHRICITLNWPSFPSTSGEFRGYTSLKTQDLDVLLSFTGIEATIKTSYLAAWSAIASWNPEARYYPSGVVNETDAMLIINSARTLIGVL